jgi:outer membrane lipoprotein carrier protein
VKRVTWTVRWGLVCAVFAGGSVGAAGNVAGQQGTALEILERASARYAGTTSLCADFVQHLSVPLLGDERSGRGRLCQERPGRFAMRFDEPAGDAVVVDGTWVWVYYPSMDATQVLRFPVASSPGGFDLHREFLERPAEKYRATREGSEKVGGRDTARIRLVPRGTAAYQGAVVWIDVTDATLRQVRVEEENGSVRTVTLSAVQMGAPPPEGWFTFTPPAGAQVIGG